LKLSEESRERLREAFSNGPPLADPTDPSLPVELIYVERVPMRGSVHLATGRVISREEINRWFDKTFAKKAWYNKWR
jgi:hypothetical protein